MQAHSLTQARVLDVSSVHVVQPHRISNPHWLVPGTPSRSQQQFGAELLNQHPFVLVPSSVSRHSWNLLVNPQLANGLYEVVMQESFGLDGRLNPPAAGLACLTASATANAYRLWAARGTSACQKASAMVSSFRCRPRNKPLFDGGECHREKSVDPPRRQV